MLAPEWPWSESPGCSQQTTHHRAWMRTPELVYKRRILQKRTSSSDGLSPSRSPAKRQKARRSGKLTSLRRQLRESSSSSSSGGNEGGTSRRAAGAKQQQQQRLQEAAPRAGSSGGSASSDPAHPTPSPLETWTPQEEADLGEALRQVRRYRRYGPDPAVPEDEFRKKLSYWKYLQWKERKTRPTHTETLQVFRLPSSIQWKGTKKKFPMKHK